MSCGGEGMPRSSSFLLPLISYDGVPISTAFLPFPCSPHCLCVFHLTHFLTHADVQALCTLYNWGLFLGWSYAKTLLGTIRITSHCIFCVLLSFTTQQMLNRCQIPSSPSARALLILAMGMFRSPNCPSHLPPSLISIVDTNYVKKLTHISKAVCQSSCCSLTCSSFQERAGSQLIACLAWWASRSEAPCSPPSPSCKFSPYSPLTSRQEFARVTLACGFLLSY